LSTYYHFNLKIKLNNYYWNDF